nr:transposase [Mesorhizobium sp.]
MPSRPRRSRPSTNASVEAVKRIDALFDIEREINGLLPGQRLAVRKERSAPLVTELERWMSRRATSSRADTI